MTPLSGRVAIVTGGASGIGRGIALGLAEDGASVAVADVRREPKRGRRFDIDEDVPTDVLVEEEFGTNAVYVETDVADEGDVDALVEAVVGEFGRIDVLVNNAGVHLPGTTRELSIGAWNETIGVNLTGPFLASRRAIPHLVESEAGRIVNVSSVNAHVGGSGPAYAASKAGIENLTRDLAAELAPEGVTVNAVLPGVIETPMQDENDDETMAREIEATPMPRIGRPRDVANAVCFLAGDRAEWITGASLLVDGGYMASR